MKSFWLTFTDKSHACCDGESEYDAKIIAEKLTDKTVAGGKYKDIEAKRLPYPASPNVWTYDHPVHGKCPQFCWKPESCAGSSACPRSPSCTS